MHCISGSQEHVRRKAPEQIDHSRHDRRGERNPMPESCRLVEAQLSLDGLELLEGELALAEFSMERGVELKTSIHRTGNASPLRSQRPHSLPPLLLHVALEQVRRVEVGHQLAVPVVGHRDRGVTFDLGECFELGKQLTLAKQRLDRSVAEGNERGDWPAALGHHDAPALRCPPHPFACLQVQLTYADVLHVHKCDTCRRQPSTGGQIIPVNLPLSGAGFVASKLGRGEPCAATGWGRAQASSKFTVTW